MCCIDVKIHAALSSLGRASAAAVARLALAVRVFHAPLGDIPTIVVFADNAKASLGSRVAALLESSELILELVNHGSVVLLSALTYRVPHILVPLSLLSARRLTIRVGFVPALHLIATGILLGTATTFAGPREAVLLQSAILLSELFVQCGLVFGGLHFDGLAALFIVVERLDRLSSVRSLNRASAAVGRTPRVAVILEVAEFLLDERSGVPLFDGQANRKCDSE